jgi:preflagellin peptidase FlaK
MKEILEGLRISACLILLTYASLSDYKTREVSDNVWIIFAPTAFALTFVELFLYEPSEMALYGGCFGLTVAFAVILFYSGGFGGADAKALMCLALAIPFYPKNLLTPLSGEVSPLSQNFFPLTVFSNSVLLAALTAIYMLLRNVYWRQKTGKKLFEEHKKESFWKKLLVSITGYKVPVEKLMEKWHLYPLEDVEIAEQELKRKLIVVPKDEGRNAILERLTNAIKTGKVQNAIWATPGLPMLIFVTVGLFTALFIGDVVWIFISFLLR